jgi:hypothetical protein
MEKLIYLSDEDYFSVQEYRLKCAMEKRAGIIVVKGTDYHVNEKGRYVTVPPFEHKMNEIQGGIARA